VIRATDAGNHQNLRRRDRADGEDDLALTPRGLLASAMVAVPNRALARQLDPSCLGAGLDGQVRASWAKGG
jgi:hypothetical protein